MRNCRQPDDLVDTHLLPMTSPDELGCQGKKMSVKQINDMTKRLNQSPQRVRTAAAMDAMQGMDMQSTMGSQATVSSTASSSRRISKREEQVLQG